jgi:hypothetical protein
LLSVGGATARAQSGSLLVADFDGEKIETTSGLLPWLYADDQFGGTSEVRAALVHPGAEASRGALRISYRVTDDSPTPFAGAWTMVGLEGRVTDLSAYRGVRFRARSKDGAAFAAGIVRFAGTVLRYTAPFEIKSDWTLVELPFDTFQAVTPAGAPAAGAPALDRKDVTSFGVTVAPARRGQFELDIDRIEFYR